MAAKCSVVRADTALIGEHTMRRTGRHSIALLTGLILLFTIAVAPAGAATLKRTWSAGLGTSGANGRVYMRSYMDATGSLQFDVKGLGTSRLWSIRVRKGTCASLGSVITTVSGFRTGGDGRYAGTIRLSAAKMNAIWPSTRNGKASIQIVYNNGASVRCGTFGFTVATRIQIPYVGINLSIIKAPTTYPPCKVAMYLRELSQPTEPGVTFLFAHARTGMFLPLLTKSKISNGASLIGKTVRVYTSNSKVHTYQIDKVRRHVKSFQEVFGIDAERLWLQTSEGPNFTYPKLIVEAKRIKSESTTYAASHPTPRPVAC
jgi:sortase (surface protein transpeptidase)